MKVSPLKDATLNPEGCDTRPPGLVDPAIDSSRFGGPLWCLSPASHWLLSASIGDWEGVKCLLCLEASSRHRQPDSQNHRCAHTHHGLPQPGRGGQAEGSQAGAIVVMSCADYHARSTNQTLDNMQHDPAALLAPSHSKSAIAASEHPPDAGRVHLTWAIAMTHYSKAAAAQPQVQAAHFLAWAQARFGVQSTLPIAIHLALYG